MLPIRVGIITFLIAISIVHEGQILIAHTRTEATCDASGAEEVVATPEALTTPPFRTKFINISIIICYVAALTVCPSTLRHRECWVGWRQRRGGDTIGIA